MNDPYVYEGTNVLINLASIKDQKELDNYETTITSIAIIELLKNPIIINSTYDIFIIHKKLFEEVYEWAGKPRSINIYKNEPVLNGLSVNYSDYRNIYKSLDDIQKQFEKTNVEKMSKKELIKFISVMISKIWQVHPFREGNTRTVCIFLLFLLKKYNLKCNVDFIGEHSKFFRNALVLASIGEYSEYEHLEMILSDAISIRIIDDTNTKYKTINDYNLEKYEYNYHQIKEDK